MCRIISFLSAKGGVGKSSIIFELSKELSHKNYKVCVLDSYFNMNSLSCKYEKNNGVDLKEYLVGSTRALETINKFSDNLYYVKTNQITYDYISVSKLIKFFIYEISKKFDYILLDVNCFNDEILSLMLESSNEAIIVLNDNSDVIRNTTKLIQKVYLYSQIKNINLVINQARVALELGGKALGEREIKDILKQEILFVFPKFYNGNIFNQNFKKVTNKNFIQKFCKSVVDNCREYIDYAKSYHGLLGSLRRKFYEKFE